MKRQTYTQEQNSLIAEYCAHYGLEPGQIVFYDNDAKPFFDREATAVLIHKLTNAVGIEDLPVDSVFANNLTVLYKITFEDGSFASSTGLANFDETIDGEAMSPEQIKSLATSRAARSALTNKGIDLVKLHEAAKAGNSNVTAFTGPADSEHAKLLREVHALGYDTSYIVESWYEAEHGRQKFTDKSGWYRVLKNRYTAEKSSHLTTEQLKDFAAFLRTQLPISGMKQAA